MSRWTAAFWQSLHFFLILSFFGNGLVAGQTVRQPLPKTPYVKLRAGLPHVRELITTRKKATVAFLGGSITYNPGWRDKVSQYLAERFPETDFTFIKAGIPSLGSLPHAFRAQQDLFSKGKVDLLFVEAAVNDRANGTDSLTQLRALEGIVRQARGNNPAVDMVLMAFADPDKLADFERHQTPVEVANHERVAAYYGLPSIDLAREVYDRIRAGEFTWAQDFKDLHPSPFGQELYYQTIRYLLNAAFDGSASGTVARPPLPARPLNKSNFERGHYRSIRDAQRKNGWQLVENWHPADSVATREGFVDRPMLEATVPGAQLDLSFTGTAVGMGLISGPDAGEVEFSVDNGAYQKMDLYTQWSHLLHLPWYKLFAADLMPGKHVLHLRVSGAKNANSKGTTCRIVYFLVNG